MEKHLKTDNYWLCGKNPWHLYTDKLHYYANSILKCTFLAEYIHFDHQIKSKCWWFSIVLHGHRAMTSDRKILNQLVYQLATVLGGGVGFSTQLYILTYSKNTPIWAVSDCLGGRGFGIETSVAGTIPVTIYCQLKNENIKQMSSLYHIKVLILLASWKYQLC